MIGYSGRPEVVLKPFPRSAQALRWLRGEPAFAQVREQAARLAALQQTLREVMPGLDLTVLALDRDTLVVGARHAASAARVRQVGPTLLAALSRAGWRIEQIRFRTRWQPPSDGPRRPPKATPGPRAIAAIAALSEQVDDPRLRAALARMAARHRPPGGTDDEQK